MGPSEALFIAQVVVLLLVGRLLGEAMQRIGQPAVMGQRALFPAARHCCAAARAKAMRSTFQASWAVRRSDLRPTGDQRGSAIFVLNRGSRSAHTSAPSFTRPPPWI